MNTKVEHIHAVHSNNGHKLKLDKIDKKGGSKEVSSRIPQWGGSRGNVVVAAIIFLLLSLASSSSLVIVSLFYELRHALSVAMAPRRQI
ncbi:hypothetical protein [Oryza sativa Japonica Group]|uniref:Os01g0859150 protein n=2 Tax=Oryza sativa subsp. japonica TaxID=39947 RepID=A0A0P0VAL0_ORYSJ|nr:hypothetical protein [Oryza sativa Japonica Group]BAD82621.1 hypothetical protein [Oryza sativa Japonica Group]BAS75323.1 Os01g0859150 [Oryza sativa Japonica Group]